MKTEAIAEQLERIERINPIRFTCARVRVWRLTKSSVLSVLRGAGPAIAARSSRLAKAPTNPSPAGTTDMEMTMHTPTDDGLHLLDVARDLMFSALETAQMEEGATAKATDDAVAYLLLAAAELVSPIELANHALPVSRMLRQAVDQALAAYVEPIIAAGDLDQLSDRGLDARAARLDAEADGHQAHADELRRHQAGRQATNGGPAA